MVQAFLGIKRKERDSNPRYLFKYTRFPSEPVQPLWHLSQLGGEPTHIQQNLYSNFAVAGKLLLSQHHITQN
jgi:hypothetical protein